MFDRRQQFLFSRLTENGYITASDLGKQMGLSEKTIRTRVKEIDKELMPHGVRIISKQGHGYRIVVTNAPLYQELMKSLSMTEDTIPASSEERIQYLLSCLLNGSDYVKLDDISDFLFISRNTLTGDLKKAEEMLNKYDVRLVRKPHYGIKAEGGEFNKRLCIANYLMKPDLFIQGHGRRSTDEMKAIGDIVLGCISEHKVRLSEVLFQNLILHIYIAVKRIRSGQCLTGEAADFLVGLGEKEMEIARAIAGKVGQCLETCFPEPEIEYMLYDINSKQNLNGWSEERFDELRAAYLAMVSRFDHQYGLISEKLKEAGVYPDTNVIVFSDHGDYTGDYTITEKVQNCFENPVSNVPLLIKPSQGYECRPGISEALAELVDIPETVADMAGVKLPYKQFGVSLMKVVKGSETHKDAVFCEGGRLHGEEHCMEKGHGPLSPYWPRLDTQCSEGPEHTKAVMIRMGKMKYIRRLYESDELYDLEKDPMELYNIINNADYGESW